VTGIKVGAPPGAAGLPQLEGAARPAVRVFARELSAMPAARLTCLCEPCLLPTSGTQAVRFEVGGAVWHGVCCRHAATRR